MAERRFSQEQTLMTENVSREFIVQLARYAELPLPGDRAEALREILGPAIARLRAIRPAGYEKLAPGLNFRVPVPPSDDRRA